MSKTKERIHDSNLRYKQGLGQNFIYDEDLLAALVASSEITKEDDVLEIGPGAGSMTKYLCDAAHHVLSVELDERLIPLLTAFLAERDNFTLVQGDVMTLNLADAQRSQPILLRSVSGHGCTGQVLYARAEGGQRVHRPAVAGNAGGAGAG